MKIEMIGPITNLRFFIRQVFETLLFPLSFGYLDVCDITHGEKRTGLVSYLDISRQQRHLSKM